MKEGELNHAREKEFDSKPLLQRDKRGAGD